MSGPAAGIRPSQWTVQTQDTPVGSDSGIRAVTASPAAVTTRSSIRPPPLAGESPGHHGVGRHHPSAGTTRPLLPPLNDWAQA
jgi:hypothetical protein